jgi:hypothetical protein
MLLFNFLIKNYQISKNIRTSILNILLSLQFPVAPLGYSSIYSLTSLFGVLGIVFLDFENLRTLKCFNFNTTVKYHCLLYSGESLTFPDQSFLLFNSSVSDSDFRILFEKNMLSQFLSLLIEVVKSYFSNKALSSSNLLNNFYSFVRICWDNTSFYHILTLLVFFYFFFFL